METPERIKKVCSTYNKKMREELPDNRLHLYVEYTGPFETCHESIYKITKDFGAWVDLELELEVGSHSYKMIYSVPIDEIKFL